MILGRRPVYYCLTVPMNALLAAHISCLEQGMESPGRLSPEAYCRKFGEVFGSPIGSHLSHNLDHYVAFVEGGMDFPDGFGIAPSTIHYQERKGA